MFDLRRTRLLSVSALLAFTFLSGFAAKSCLQAQGYLLSRCPKDSTPICKPP